MIVKNYKNNALNLSVSTVFFLLSIKPSFLNTLNILESVSGEIFNISATIMFFVLKNSSVWSHKYFAILSFESKTTCKDTIFSRFLIFFINEVWIKKDKSGSE